MKPKIGSSVKLRPVHKRSHPCMKTCHMMHRSSRSFKWMLGFTVASYYVISATCNKCISRLCHDASVCLSVCLSVTEVHWRITANLGFKFRSHFTAHWPPCCWQAPCCLWPPCFLRANHLVPC